MNIIKGKIKKAQKIVIYGPEGIGKSSFAAKFPNAIFSDTEGSTYKLDVSRFPDVTSWSLLLDQAKYVRDYRPCSTYIIDTADWAEKLCADQVCAKANKTGIEDFGYGKGYVYLQEEFGKFLNLLSEIINVGVNVVFVAHSTINKFEQPDEMGAYDRYELKLSKKVAPMVKEWADALFFVNYKTYIITTEDKKTKAQGGKRTLYTQHSASWDAKNRDDLPEELDFDFELIKHIIPDFTADDFATPTPVSAQTQEWTNERATEVINNITDDRDFEEIEEIEEIPEEQDKLKSNDPAIQKLYDLMNANSVSVDDVEFVVSEKGYYPKGTPIANYDKEFIEGCLIAAWSQVYEMIKEIKKTPF